MVQGSMLVVILVIAVILMVLLISKMKFHPFVALFAVALAMCLAVGTLPVVSTFFGNPVIALSIGPFIIAAALKTAQGSDYGYTHSGRRCGLGRLRNITIHAINFTRR